MATWVEVEDGRAVPVALDEVLGDDHRRDISVLSNLLWFWVS